MVYSMFHLISKIPICSLLRSLVLGYETVHKLKATVSLLGKVVLPDSGSSDCYFMFRAFIPGEAETAKLHCIHMEEIEKPDGDKVFRAIYGQNDPLEWFDT